MNKLYGAIAMLMGLNVGMNIVSNIWSPSHEKILLAIIYGAIGIIWIFKIKETPNPKTPSSDEE